MMGRVLMGVMVGWYFWFAVWEGHCGWTIKAKWEANGCGERWAVDPLLLGSLMTQA